MWWLVPEVLAVMLLPKEEMVATRHLGTQPQLVAVAEAQATREYITPIPVVPEAAEVYSRALISEPEHPEL
jgi:hypothetical protein